METGIQPIVQLAAHVDRRDALVVLLATVPVRIPSIVVITDLVLHALGYIHGELVEMVIGAIGMVALAALTLAAAEPIAMVLVLVVLVMVRQGFVVEVILTTDAVMEVGIVKGHSALYALRR